MENLIPRWLHRNGKKKKKMEMLAGSSAYNIFLFKNNHYVCASSMLGNHF